jgi:hypothetical protein
VEFRKVNEMTADELLAHLTHEPQRQLALFVKMGGDPNDHNYARISFLTKKLRDRGVQIESSRAKGVWLAAA